MGVIGVGSHHGSDAAGWLACEMLRAHATSTQIEWHSCRSPMQLPDLVVDYKTVVILDAVLSDKPIGQALLLRWPVKQETYDSTCSSHGLGVIEALKLASTLGQLPLHTYILGITINSQQQDVTPIVNNALPHLQRELEKIQRSLSPNHACRI